MRLVPLIPRTFYTLVRRRKKNLQRCEINTLPHCLVFDFNQRFLAFFSRITNGYNSLPRNATLRESLYSPVPRSRSSASIGGMETSKQPSRPPSVASTSAGSSRSKPKSSSGGSRSHHASLSIAQIQRELKRGEMVQVNDLKEKIQRGTKLRHLQCNRFN